MWGWQWWGALVVVAVVGVVTTFLIGLLLILPFGLALLTIGWDVANKRRTLSLQDALSVLTLYRGRVWHTRFRPARHSFTYPVFMFEVDLTKFHQLVGNALPSTQDECDRVLYDAMWPLSLVVRFASRNHLKNGEGLATTSSSSTTQKAAPLLLQRIQNMIREEDERQKQQQQRQRQQAGDVDEDVDDGPWDLLGGTDDGATNSRNRRYRAVLLTNLSYYGYCFNPVSYYLVLSKNDVKEDDDESNVAAVIGEVSNTPWGEMHCYVLLPPPPVQPQSDNVDNDDVVTEEHEEEALEKPAEVSRSRRRRFVFPKTFHVSPFMEMNYDYDWSFHYSTNPQGGITMDIHNSLLVGQSDAGTAPPVPARRQRQFHAHLLIDSSTTTSVWSIAYQMSCYPAYGMIVQLWIHYQAFWLFLIRRVPFQPHPKGSETHASRIIGAIMTPLFALQALWDERSKKAPSSRLRKVKEGPLDVAAAVSASAHVEKKRL